MREFIYVRTVTKRRRAQISQDPRNEFCRTQTSKEFFVVSLLSRCLHFDTIECSSKPNSVYSFTFSLAINRYPIDGFCSRCPESSPTKQIVQLSSFHIISMSPRKFDAIHFCHAMKKGWENMVIAKWLERNSAQKQHFGQTRWFFLYDGSHSTLGSRTTNSSCFLNKLQMTMKRRLRLRLRTTYANIGFTAAINPNKIYHRLGRCTAEHILFMSFVCAALCTII